VSETVSRGQEAARAAGHELAGQEPRDPHGYGRWIALGLGVLIAAGAVSAWGAGAFSSSSPSGAPPPGTPAPATAAVTQRDIAALLPVTATLGYAGTYTVTGQGSGTLTWLPAAGQVISQGQVLYKVDNGSPVVLLYGSVPAWRALAPGASGEDVSQLNHDLAQLGDATAASIAAHGWGDYSAATAAGVRQLESRLGVSGPSGTLARGQVVFEPEALRVSQVTGTLGGPVAGLADEGQAAGQDQASGTDAGPGSVLTATSDRHVVLIPLDASDQSQVKQGDAVSVILPGGATTPGVISAVGTVAATTPGANGTTTTTIPVTVTLARPSAAGTLDEAPVTVNITTSTAHDALVVPVGALLAQGPGQYAVEVAGPGSARRYVPVTLGIFDDSDGLVQVTGALTPGERVVVAAS
jgi:hypothetical protein